MLIAIGSARARPGRREDLVSDRFLGVTPELVDGEPSMALHHVADPV